MTENYSNKIFKNKDFLRKFNKNCININKRVNIKI